MKWSFFSLWIIFFLSCQMGTQSQSGDKDFSSESSAYNSDSTAPLTVKDIAYDVEIDRIAMPYLGDLKQSARWRDKNGRNTLIISSIEAEEKNDKTELFAYTFIENNDEVKPLWELSDYVTGECDRDIYLIPNSLEILDIDKNGVAENLFMYLLSDNCDATPVKTKLMVHSGKTELIIKGLTKVFLLPIPEVKAESKKISHAFEKVDPLIKTYASEKWDNYVKQEAQEFDEAMGK